MWAVVGLRADAAPITRYTNRNQSKMKTMKLWRLALAMLAAFSLASCSSDDEEVGREYQPAHRSTIFNGVKLMLTDADGNDLGSSTEILSSMKVYGELSRQYASIECSTEDGLTYLKFNADLPDEHDIRYDEDKQTGKGTSAMTVSMDGKTARLIFAFMVSNSPDGEEAYGNNSIRITGAQLGSKTLTGGEDGDIVVVLAMGDDGFSLTDEFPVPEEVSATYLKADSPLTNKVYLGSGYDVTGAYLSNACLRENVIDLGKCSDDQVQKTSLRNGTGIVSGDVDNARKFLNGLCEALDFKNEGEPGDVYFAGTFTDNPLFMDASERGDDYKFLMYMDRYSIFDHRLHLGLYPSNAELERVLTDDFKKALAEESAERIVERFGTHVLMNAQMGLNILSLYRSGLKANTRDAARFEASMFRRINDIYTPIFWNKTDPKATKGGALVCQFSGGDTNHLLAAIGTWPLAIGESADPIADWWNESCNAQTYLSLCSLQGEDLWPIYKLVPDEAKRVEVQRAVKAYIHSHQLK